MRPTVLLLCVSMHPVLSHANGPRAMLVEPPPLRTAGERVTDGIGVVFATAALTIGGGGLGYLLGSDECEAGGRLFCIPPNIIFMASGGIMGLIGGPYLYDRWTDRDGSVLGAYFGMLGGGLVAALLGRAVAGDDEDIALGAGLAGSVVGLAAGYGAFDPLDAQIAVTAPADAKAPFGLGVRGRF